MATQMPAEPVDCDGLKKLIREVPDFPKKGILFYDITTLLKDKVGFARLIDALSANYIGKEIDLVLGMEARGFIFGPALAYRLNAGFVPVRKPGKLPAETLKISYELEYGSNALEVHKDAIRRGERVLIVDDLLATGGTAVATAELARRPCGANSTVVVLEVHKDAIRRGERVLIVDDLLATGGTAVATAELARGLGAQIAGLAFVVELDFLRGREKLAKYDVFSLLHYDR